MNQSISQGQIQIIHKTLNMQVQSPIAQRRELNFGSLFLESFRLEPWLWWGLGEELDVLWVGLWVWWVLCFALDLWWEWCLWGVFVDWRPPAVLGGSGAGDGTISGRVSKTAGTAWGLACGQELVSRGDREAVSSRPLVPCVHCGGRCKRWWKWRTREKGMGVTKTKKEIVQVRNSGSTLRWFKRKS